MVAVTTFIWVQEPYEMGVTGLKTSGLKSKGFSSYYEMPGAIGKDYW